MPVHTGLWLKPAALLIPTAVAAATVISCACAATNELLPATAVDAVFEPGLATLKKATGIIEGAADRSRFNWTPNLQLLIGIKSVEGSRQSIHFVELTTVRPPLTNAAGLPWSPPLRTNRFDWSGTNKASPPRTFEFVSGLYPVRVRVFDHAGRKLKDGETQMPWELLTNSLAETCRLSLPSTPGGKPDQPPDTDEFVRPFLGGMLSLVTVFVAIQSSPALGDICEEAHCAIRLPGLWSMASAVVGAPFMISIEPRFEDVSLAEPARASAGVSCYRLPVDMKNGKRTLTSVEILVGPSGGAEVLLGGMQSIRAAHPTKPNQVFTAQVLATGLVRDEPYEAIDTAR